MRVVAVDLVTGDPAGGAGLEMSLTRLVSPPQSAVAELLSLVVASVGPGLVP